MSKAFLIALVLLSIAGVGAFIYIDQIGVIDDLPVIVQTDNPINPNNPGDNPVNPINPQTPTEISGTGDTDDWKYSENRQTESMSNVTLSSPMANSTSGYGGHGAAVGAAPATKSANLNSMPSAMMMDSTLGLSVGGAKDVNNFRENIKNGYLPLLTDITYEGLYYDYYFDTGKSQECSKLFCPSYSRAVSADPFSNTDEYYLTVGLNSGIKESDFNRKKLNLVVVLDISGSMGSPFDQYYYDQYGNRRSMTPEEEKEASKTKIKIATESIAAMTKHLKNDDRFGVVLFDDNAYVAKPLSLVGTTDMSKIRQHILDITEQGSTNMEDGIVESTKLFQELKGANQNEYENRIIFLTDAQPNTGDTSQYGFTGLTKKNADDKIYMTFIGIGVDFNTQLIESITKIRGANYYAVHSSKEFSQRMDEEFDYMVTPLVFNLKLNVQAKGYEIKKVYGSPEADLATGELMKINTLFPSKTTEEGTKGGIVLLQLKKISDNPSLTLTTSYEDRAGVTGGDTAQIVFEGKKAEYFENSGIRKGIILARYANMIKDWIADERSHYGWSQPRPWEPMIDDRAGIYALPYPYPSLGQWERQSVSLKVAPAYKKLFGIFNSYFEKEMKAIGDKDMQKESDLLRKLSS